MAKTAKKAEIVPVVDPMLVEMRDDVGLVEGFVRGLGEFFTGLRSLQQRATHMEEASRVWAQPTTKEEDAILMAAVREARGLSKEVDAHTEVATRLHRLHRKLTAARDGATKPLDVLIERATRLHGAYEQAEARRVREEEARLRREAEAKAEEDRRRELAELEKAALQAEASSPDLSARERTFVDRVHHLGEELAFKAAEIAGYQNARQTAQRLLGTEKIRKALDALAAARAARQQAEAVKETPVQPEYVPPVETRLNAGTRYLHSAEVENVSAFVLACLDGTVPKVVALATLQVNGPAMNAQAKAFKEGINDWPGIRYKKTPVVV